MHKKAIVLLISMTILVVGVSIGFLLRQPLGEEPGGEDGLRGGFPLAAPAFAQGTPANQFPTNEAGISCYANAAQAIDLEKAQALFRVVEATTPDYAIGTVELVGHAEDMWPHAYIAKNGWILLYYPKSDPASKMVQWYGYERDVIRTTTLRDTLISLARNLTLDVSKVDAGLQYYHFQYPQATKFLIVADSTEDSDSFSYTIPTDLTLLDASFSHSGNDLGDSGAWTKIDGEEVMSSGGGTYVYCRSLAGKHLTPTSAHPVEIHRSSSRGWIGVALVFLYR